MSRPPLARLAPWAGAVAVLGLLWVAAPEIYTGTFSDAGTFARVAGLVAVLAIWAVVMRRVVRHRALSLALAAGPSLVIGAVLLWPYLRPPTEVDEAFPEVVAAAPDDATATTTTTNPATTTTNPATTTTNPATTTSTVPPAPVELRRGAFQGLTGHRGSGDAAVYDLGDGTTLLRFEDVDIGSGPELEVYLVPGADQRGLGGGVHVAALTAERGNQNYTVPGAVDLTSGTWTVLVWCETFDLEVANATLA